MNTLLEKTKVTERFRTFNTNLISILDIDSIEQIAPFARDVNVDTFIGDLYYKFYSDIIVNNAYEQILTEIENTLGIIKEIKNNTTNRPINPSTKRAILLGIKKIRSKLTPLKSEVEEKLRLYKSKTKGKYEDVRISEREYALFIILASKYGLISNVPKANEKALAFSALTNISDQSLRDWIGSKYQVNPNELLLKRENLDVLKETLINICDEIKGLREDANY
jgi:hypothetical protein